MEFVLCFHCIALHLSIHGFDQSINHERNGPNDVADIYSTSSPGRFPKDSVRVPISISLSLFRSLARSLARYHVQRVSK